MSYLIKLLPLSRFLSFFITPIGERGRERKQIAVRPPYCLLSLPRSLSLSLDMREVEKESKRDGGSKSNPPGPLYNQIAICRIFIGYLIKLLPALAVILRSMVQTYICGMMVPLLGRKPKDSINSMIGDESFILIFIEITDFTHPTSWLDVENQRCDSSVYPPPSNKKVVRCARLQPTPGLYWFTLMDQQLPTLQLDEGTSR